MPHVSLPVKRSKIFLRGVRILLVAVTTFILSGHVERTFAGITVFDTVTSAGVPVSIKALTKSRVFPEGGKRVMFYVNGKESGMTLSGGDGYAFMKYSSLTPGIYKVKVEAGDQTDEGLILLTGKSDRVVLIEIETTLFQSVMAMKPSKEARETLEEIAKSFRIIYVTRMLGVSTSRQWIKKYELPLSVVYRWQGPDGISELRERGVNLYAIVAPVDILSEVPDIARRFSFEDNDQDTVIDEWKDLLEHLD